MILNTTVNVRNKFFWLLLSILGPFLVYAEDQPVPTDAPPDFAPPAGPPPPPPLPIDDFIIPMIFVGMLLALFYFVKIGNTQHGRFYNI